MSMTPNTPEGSPNESPTPAANGRSLAARRRPRDASGRLLPNEGNEAKRKDEGPRESLLSAEESNAYLYHYLGGQKKVLRMYANAVKKSKGTARLDALHDIVKAMTKGKDKAITEAEAAMMTDEELAQL